MIGLAASAIALGPHVAQYLEDIIPPVLACFGDQDARVRYYACESMYNIAKVAKGEILLYFNEIFDALCRLAADTELTVKNGADLLDRLIKDIVAEKAATYVAVIHTTPEAPPPDPAEDNDDPSKPVLAHEPVQDPHGEPAFQLSRFIPLLIDRIYVINPFTRMFLVSWITLLDSIPDLELVSYLPDIIGGLLNFLSDTNVDVRVATQGALDGFLHEIKRITELKRTIFKLRAQHVTNEPIEASPAAASTSADTGSKSAESKEGDKADSSQRQINISRPVGEHGDAASIGEEQFVTTEGVSIGPRSDTAKSGDTLTIEESYLDEDEGLGSNFYLASAIAEGIYLPGQDVKVDYAKVIEILLSYLDSTEQEIQLTVLKWIESFFDISPDDLLPFVPRFLSVLLPTMAHDNEQLRKSAERVNDELMQLIMSDTVIDEEKRGGELDDPFFSSTPNLPPLKQGFSVRSLSPNANRSLSPQPTSGRHSLSGDRRDDESLLSKLTNTTNASAVTSPTIVPTETNESSTANDTGAVASHNLEELLDYPATVNALTLHFLNEREETRVAALDWLLMLHRKASSKILAINDGTFPALLKTLSDSSDAVVTKDLQLLAQISYNSEDDYFASFMLNLLSLFSTDRKLLETRGNLIIRQLCVSLNPERIYRTLAEILEKEDDVEFASIMIQNLNNNLITAPELQSLRQRLRNLEAKEGTNFFISLFRSWCHNAVATFSLCLLAQAYEQAFHLLQIFADLEITVTLLIQVDKLIQLLESPVFTCRFGIFSTHRYIVY